VRGQYHAALSPGQYWYLPWFTTVRRVDVRPRFVPIAGQGGPQFRRRDVESEPRRQFRGDDPNTAVNTVKDFQETLYTELQLALRQIIGSVDIDALLAARDDISNRLMEMTGAKAQALGLRLITVQHQGHHVPRQAQGDVRPVVGARKRVWPPSRRPVARRPRCVTSPTRQDDRVQPEPDAASHPSGRRRLLRQHLDSGHAAASRRDPGQSRPEQEQEDPEPASEES